MKKTEYNYDWGFIHRFVNRKGEVFWIWKIYSNRFGAHPYLTQDYCSDFDTAFRAARKWLRDNPNLVYGE